MALGLIPAGISLGGRMLGGLGSAIGRGTTAVGRGVGGLLGKTGSLAKKGALPAAGAAGIYGLNKNLEELGDDMYATSGGGGGLFGAGGGGGGGGGGSTVNAASATSVLSDADSSDPVVRQLQDIERVLQSIKGDTATLVTGIGKMGSANNGNAARNMFGNNRDKPVGDLKSLAAAVAAALFAQGAKTDEMAADTNADGIPDNQQDKGQVAVDRELQDLSVKKSGGSLAVTAVEQTAKLGAKGAAAATDAVAGALEKRAAKAAASAAPTPKPPSNVVNIDRSKPVPTAPPAAANDPVSPKPKPASVGSKVGAKTAKIAKAIPKYVGNVAAKAVPLLGAFMGAGFAIEKLFKGDFVGAGMELGGVLLPGPSGLLIDLPTAARDVYMDVHDGADPFKEEERNSEGYGQRWQEVLDAVQEYAGNLFRRASEEIPDQVEARPQVTTPAGRGRMNNAKRISEQREVKEWDEKYGDMYNADGTATSETLERIDEFKAQKASQPIPVGQDTNFGERLMERGQREVDKMSDVMEGFQEGAERAVPFKMSADSVEISTQSATSSELQEQANRLGTEVGGMVATTQRQGERSVPVQQPVQVSVASAKTSFPQDNASLEFINRRGSYLT